MPYALPADADERPVVIDGAGTLGRRIAAVYAAGGSDVRIFDLSAEQREGVPEGPRELLDEYVDRGRLGTKSGRGFYEYTD
jgi:3-hydroxybutyryl-CoA dehydrogenase